MPWFALDLWTLFWQKSTHVVNLGKPFQRILKAEINAYPNFERQVPKVQELYQNDLKGIGLDHGWHWQRGSGFELDGQKLFFQQEDKCSKSEFLTVQLFREKVLLSKRKLYLQKWGLAPFYEPFKISLFCCCNNYHSLLYFKMKLVVF